MGIGDRFRSAWPVWKDYVMAKPDMAAEADRLKASIKQAVGKLTGDPTVEAQATEKTPEERTEKAKSTKAQQE